MLYTVITWYMNGETEYLGTIVTSYLLWWGSCWLVKYETFMYCEPSALQCSIMAVPEEETKKRQSEEIKETLRLSELLLVILKMEKPGQRPFRRRCTSTVGQRFQAWSSKPCSAQRQILPSGVYEFQRWCWHLGQVHCLTISKNCNRARKLYSLSCVWEYIRSWCWCWREE